MVDYALKRYRGIGKAERHNLVFIISITSLKYSFIFISFFNLDIVKPY